MEPSINGQALFGADEWRRMEERRLELEAMRRSGLGSRTWRKLSQVLESDLTHALYRWPIGEGEGRTALSALVVGESGPAKALLDKLNDVQLLMVDGLGPATLRELRAWLAQGRVP
jgi:hypothetical protein